MARWRLLNCLEVPAINPLRWFVYLSLHLLIEYRISELDVELFLGVIDQLVDLSFLDSCFQMSSELLIKLLVRFDGGELLMNGWFGLVHLRHTREIRKRSCEYIHLVIRSTCFIIQFYFTSKFLSIVRIVSFWVWGKLFLRLNRQYLAIVVQLLEMQLVLELNVSFFIFIHDILFQLILRIICKLMCVVYVPQLTRNVVFFQLFPPSFLPLLLLFLVKLLIIHHFWGMYSVLSDWQFLSEFWGISRVKIRLAFLELTQVIDQVIFLFIFPLSLDEL